MGPEPAHFPGEARPPTPRPRARPPLAKKLVSAIACLLAEVPVLQLRLTEYARKPAGGFLWQVPCCE